MKKETALVLGDNKVTITIPPAKRHFHKDHKVLSESICLAVHKKIGNSKDAAGLLTITELAARMEGMENTHHVQAHHINHARKVLPRFVRDISETTLEHVPTMFCVPINKAGLNALKKTKHLPTDTDVARAMIATFQPIAGVLIAPHAGTIFLEYIAMRIKQVRGGQLAVTALIKAVAPQLTTSQIQKLLTLLTPEVRLGLPDATALVKPKALKA